MKQTMLSLLKDLLAEIKSQLLKLKKEKLLDSILEFVNMTRTKLSAKRENAHLLPSETSLMKSRKKKRKSSLANSADDSLFLNLSY